MLKKMKKLLTPLLVLFCTVLSSCLTVPASEETSSSSSTTGTKSATIVITSAELQSAVIDSDETSYTFPSTLVESSNKVDFTLTNTGDVPAKITSAPQMEAPFSYAEGSFPGKGGTCTKTINPAEVCNIVIDFSPTTMEKKQSIFKLIYNNGKTSRTFEKTFFGKGISSPTITSITPNFGPIAGGTTITLEGTQLFSGAAVLVGGRSCAASYTPPTVLTCTLPSGTMGAVDVKVTNTDSKTYTISNGFTYVPPPTVTAVSPTAGALAGGTTVTLTGTGFYSGASISIGGVNCSSVNFISATSASCITGAHAAGVTSIILTNADSQSGTGTNLYTYQPAPTVTSVLPTAGALAGGTSITITGTDFVSGASVTVGGVACSSVNVNSATSITCTTGAHSAGATDIIVTNADTQSGTGSGLYTYQPVPTVTAIGPSRIYIDGGRVTVTGTNFVTGAIVTINATACGSSQVTSSTTITCTVGSNAVGTYSVIVTNADNQTGTLTNGLTVADNDVWIPTSTTGAAAARNSYMTVWTGSKMLVYAGWPYYFSNTYGGHSFDPVTNSWEMISVTNGPATYIQGGAISLWTGNKFILWGGYGVYNTGGLYDPVANSWTSISTSNAPLTNNGCTGVWTGSRMIVWGGQVHLTSSSRTNAGAIYNPETNSWTTMTTTDAPSDRFGAGGVWTGSNFIVWGGANTSTVINTGGIYNLSTNTWSPITTTNAPSASYPHSYWTGSKMLNWGSVSYTNSTNTGGLYDPNANSWTTMSTLNAPPSGGAGASVWTGSKLLTWAGTNAQNIGAIYDPDVNSWTRSVTNGAPSPVTNQSLGIGVATGWGNVPGTDLWSPGAVWTGSRMIVFGGCYLDDTCVNTGGMYIPPTDAAANTWTSITSVGFPFSVAYSSNLVTVWTGSKMISWGGGQTGAPATYYNQGALYDPTTDVWTLMSTLDAPSPRLSKGVWSGNKLIVWGGVDTSSTYYNDGGLYDPATNTWTVMSTTNAPAPRNGHVFHWTGGKAVALLGGDGGSPMMNSGGMYDPSTNTWTVTATLNAPSGNAFAASAWSGSKILTWGGQSGWGLVKGGNFDPANNTWSIMTTVNEPSPRIYHGAVWTGSKFAVWGGVDASEFNSGGLYDPNANTWTATSTINAPVGVQAPVMLWTGRDVIAWSGYSTLGQNNQGGKYDPLTNTWTSMTTLNAPHTRAWSSSVWTGSKMLIWGGKNNADLGGIYTP